MLDHPVHHHHPWPFLTDDAALPLDRVVELRALFEGDVPWERHDSFYQCFLADVTERVDPALRAGLLARMRALVDVPLGDRVRVTAQRMVPGDRALPHTDRPLVGFEAVRLVVQLEDGWSDDDGGLFLVHRDAAGAEVELVRSPRPGSAFGFVMTPASHHTVTPTLRRRDTVVFHFWHAGNTDAVAAHVGALLDGRSFAELPAALDPIAADAETRLDEERTLRAATVALIVHAWGYDDADVVAAYRAALGEGGDLGDELDTAVQLAGWLTRLRLDDFDVAGWSSLRAVLAGRHPERWPRLEPCWSCGFPPDHPTSGWARIGKHPPR